MDDITKIEKAMIDLAETVEMIKKGEDINFAFRLKYLSGKDYRDESQTVIDKYVEIFLEGAYFTEIIPSIERTARNSPASRRVKDPYKWVKLFMGEDFHKVQQPFWDIYKEKCKFCKVFPVEYVEPKNIYRIMKELKK